VRSAPAKRTYPSSGARRPATSLRRVLFPLPDGPKRARTSPSWTSRATSSRKPGKAFLRARASTLPLKQRPRGQAPGPRGLPAYLSPSFFLSSNTCWAVRLLVPQSFFTSAAVKRLKSFTFLSSPQAVAMWLRTAAISSSFQLGEAGHDPVVLHALHLNLALEAPKEDPDQVLPTPLLGQDLRHVAREGREGPGDALPVRLVAPRALGVELGAIRLGQGQAADEEENRQSLFHLYPPGP
jgi:hypothetical protein